MATEKTFHLTGQVGRLDKVITQLMPEMSRTTAQNLIKSQLVTVDDQVQKSNYKLQGTETIRIIEPVQEALTIQPERMSLDIRFEDQDVLVVNKPAGMVVHPSKGHSSGTLVNGLVDYLGTQMGNAQDAVRPGLVHRIDKDTSGLLIIAKNDRALQKLNLQLQDHTLGRTYVALVHHPMEVPQGIIELPIGRDPSNRTRFKVIANGKPAITHFKVLENFQDASYLELNLKTGRTHQIRVHMEHINHPIIGDPVYHLSDQATKSYLSQINTGQYLHAKALHFIHPSTEEWIEVEAPLPDRFNQLLGALE